RIRADVPEQFAHERLTKPRHFGVAFAVRIEIRAAFSAAHRQRGQRIFKNLFEREKFQDAEIDGGMKSQSAFVRADRAVHLDSEPALHVDLAFVVLPRDPEHDHAFRLDNSLENFRFAIARVSIQNQRERLDYFLDRLVKLGFARVLGLLFGHQIRNVIFTRWPQRWQYIERSAYATKLITE